MSDVVIRAEGLGKKYVIGHQTRRESYSALRDVVARGALTFLRKAGDMVHGRPIIEGDELEEMWALADVNFEVEHGEALGIIGRNGAGKSTLLKILSRITEPTTGRVRIRGRVASLLEVGTGFHPELTGRENVFLNGAILGMSRAEIGRKFDEIVAFAEIERFLDTPVKRYSSGMYVRLAFGVAAHLEPEILIVDEVLAVGDAEFQKKCLGKMSEVTKGGRTILFVSHNLKAVEHFCKRGLLVDRGRLILDGTVHDVVAEYLQRGVSRLGGVARSLSDELDLVVLELTPGTVRAREPLAFVLELEVKRECHIHDIHLFVYNSFGERVAIIDLRDSKMPGGTRDCASGRRLKFSGQLARVTFVEGSYRIGLCVRTSRDFQDHFDLVDLHVSCDTVGGKSMPYAPEHQGSTLLDYKFFVEVV